MIGDAAVHHSARASLAFEPDCYSETENPSLPRRGILRFANQLDLLGDKREERRRSSGPVAEWQRFRFPKEPNGVSAKHSKHPTGFALTPSNSSSKWK
jgi:hypothetical protein